MLLKLHRKALKDYGLQNGGNNDKISYINMSAFHDRQYPDAIDPNRVGKYPIYVNSGGGIYYDEVLEYRVWIHPPGEDVYYRAFVTYEEALGFSKSTPNSEKPLVLVSQEEHINEPEPGKYIHIKKPRITEWLPEWLENSKGTRKNIPIFFENNKT